MTVKSFTPSRIGIITSRRSWSKPTCVGVNFAGISLGRPGYFSPAGACATREAATRKLPRIGVSVRRA